MDISRCLYSEPHRVRMLRDRERSCAPAYRKAAGIFRCDVRDEVYPQELNTRPEPPVRSPPIPSLPYPIPSLTPLFTQAPRSIRPLFLGLPFLLHIPNPIPIPFDTHSFILPPHPPDLLANLEYALPLRDSQLPVPSHPPGLHSPQVQQSLTDQKPRNRLSSTSTTSR